MSKAEYITTTFLIITGAFFWYYQAVRLSVWVLRKLGAIKEL